MVLIMATQKVAEGEFSGFLSRLEKIGYDYGNEVKGGPNTMRFVMEEFVKKHGSDPEAVGRFTKVLLERYAHGFRNDEERERYDRALNTLVRSLKESNQELMSMIQKEVGVIKGSKDMIHSYASVANDIMFGDEDKVGNRLSQIRDGELRSVFLDAVFGKLIRAYKVGEFKDESADRICLFTISLAKRHKDLEHSLEAAHEFARKRVFFKIEKSD
jgi:hypothetical protein